MVLRVVIAFHISRQRETGQTHKHTTRTTPQMTTRRNTRCLTEQPSKVARRPYHPLNEHGNKALTLNTGANPELSRVNYLLSNLSRRTRPPGGTNTMYSRTARCPRGPQTPATSWRRRARCVRLDAGWNLAWRMNSHAIADRTCTQRQLRRGYSFGRVWRPRRRHVVPGHVRDHGRYAYIYTHTHTPA